MSEKIKLQVNASEILVSPEELAKTLDRLVFIDKATVSYSRGLVARDYGDGKEDIFFSLNVNFSTMWEAIPKESLLDPVRGPEIQKITKDLIMDKIARAQLVCYQTTLYSLLARAKDLGLRKILPSVEAEVDKFGSPNGFDPLGVFQTGDS